MELANQHRSGSSRSVERLAIGRRVSECEIDCLNILIPGTVAVEDPVLERNRIPPTRANCSERDEFMRTEVVTGANGPGSGYLAKVAANSLDIVARELAIGDRRPRRTART